MQFEANLIANQWIKEQMDLRIDEILANGFVDNPSMMIVEDGLWELFRSFLHHSRLRFPGQDIWSLNLSNANLWQCLALVPWFMHLDYNHQYVM